MDNADYSPDFQNYEYGVIITYTCVLGYYKSSGDLTRTCVEGTGAQGVWSGTKPVCVGKLGYKLCLYLHLLFMLVVKTQEECHV